MRLTSFTDFGLRALMRLAAEPGQVFTTEDLAREFAVSRHHLTKVLQELAAAGLVRTQRGAGGGVLLAQPAEEIRIGEVVRRLERGQALVECFHQDGGHCPLMPGCRLRGVLAEAAEAFLEVLNRRSLADCTWRPRRSRAA